MISVPSAHDLNIRKKQFWELQSVLASQRIEHPIVGPLALKAFNAELERDFRSCRSLEAHLEDAARRWLAAGAPSKLRAAAALPKVLEREPQEFLEKYCAAQQERAKRPRGKITEEGKTMTEFVRELAMNPEYRHDTKKELWPHLKALLEAEGLNAGEVVDQRDPEKWKYEYTNHKGQKKTISFHYFEALVTRAKRVIPH